MYKEPTPPWTRPAPPSRAPTRHLTDAQKAAARKRAEEAGRRYPNLVDTLWALRLDDDGSLQS